MTDCFVGSSSKKGRRIFRHPGAQAGSKNTIYSIAIVFSCKASFFCSFGNVRVKTPSL